MHRREISVEALRHRDKHRNTPTAGLDPQLVWRGKDDQDWSWSDLIVQAPPLYTQDKVHRRFRSTTCCDNPRFGATTSAMASSMSG
jgi:hypothetical protein